MNERKSDLLAMGVLVLLLSGVYFDVLLLGNNLFTRDLTIYHYPMKKVVRDTVLDGHFPYWNRLFAAGQPMAANPAYEVFYPPQWLTFLPDYNLGFKLHVLFHAYLAAIGAFLFLRSRGARRWVAFLGGAAFVLSGPFVSVFNLLPFMFSVAWTPWIALFAGRYFDSRSRRDLALTVFFLGMQAMICEPTTLLQTWFLLGVWGAFSGWASGGDTRVGAALRGFSTAVLAVVAGVFVAAVQFLPGLDHANDSVRRLGFEWDLVSQWSFPSLRLVELVFPNFLGSSEAGGPLYWGGALYPRGDGPYLYSVYIGLALAMLAVAGLIGRRRGSLFVALAMLVSLAMAIGVHSPLPKLLFDLGLLPSIRYPEKFILLGVFVAMAWGCLVLEDIMRGDRKLARLTLALLGITGVVALGFFLWSFNQTYVEWFTGLWPGSDAKHAELSRIHWLIAFLRAAAFAGALEVLRRVRSRAAFALLALFLVADLAPLGNQINPRMPERFFEAPPLLEHVEKDLGDHRVLHIGALARQSGDWAGYFQSHDSYWVLRNGLFPSLPATWGIPTVIEYDIDETHLVHTREFMNFAVDMIVNGKRDWVAALAPMSNVKTLLTFRVSAPEVERIAGDWERIEPVDIVTLQGWPRYYFASEVVTIRDRAEMLERLLSQDWPYAVAFMYSPGALAGRGRVLAMDETPNDVKLEIEADEPATLVASVTRHRYWKATLDGEQVPIEVVNHAFQGIRVPSGRHSLRMSYFNPIVPAGIAISLVMLSGLVIASTRRSMGR